MNVFNHKGHSLGPGPQSNGLPDTIYIFSKLLGFYRIIIF